MAFGDYPTTVEAARSPQPISQANLTFTALTIDGDESEPARGARASV